MPDDAPHDFIRERIEEDNRKGTYGGRIVTRFPPEPNGYLHIGHAKSICLNFGIAREQNAPCHLRFDDTNPVKEDREYVDAIKTDVRWLGFDWGEHEYYASDYFDRLYELAVELIRREKAYVCDISGDAWAEYRGVPTRPGKASPNRDRPVDESLDLFTRMKDGEFGDGTYVLRAKIDMASPNLHLRDPAIYRIRHATHHRTGDQWCIYPMYDFAHSLSDSIEKITHSLCTLEFEVHRPLYEWFQDALDVTRTQQIEFARLNMTHTVLSKRKLAQLVEEKHVASWDDPRMPTISGLRRRGYTPKSIHTFCEKIGIAKRENTVELALLEHSLRADLEESAPRAMAVLDPLKIVLTNYDETCATSVTARNHPSDESMGTRTIRFSRELWIERSDFMEDPPKKYFRLAPGQEVRLRYAYIIRCDDVVRAPSGEITELRCSLDPETLGANPSDGRKVKGIIHWVCAQGGRPAEFRLYEHLFLKENPDDVDEGGTFLDSLNPESLRAVRGWVEPALAQAEPGTRFQFERVGYFCTDPDSQPSDHPVFNKTVSLKDSWARQNA